jgi:Lar family restriction alleviation protein
MTEIKACPFCGASGEDVSVYGDMVTPYYIECNKCDAWGPNADTEAEAIQKWNAAADRIEELKAENESLRAALPTLARFTRTISAPVPSAKDEQCNIQIIEEQRHD